MLMTYTHVSQASFGKAQVKFNYLSFELALNCQALSLIKTSNSQRNMLSGAWAQKIDSAFVVGDWGRLIGLGSVSNKGLHINNIDLFEKKILSVFSF